jgi:RNA polymerase sigma-70 factor (ECF subfamily)
LLNAFQNDLKVPIFEKYKGQNQKKVFWQPIQKKSDKIRFQYLVYIFEVLIDFILDEKYLISGLKSKNKIVFNFIFNYYYSGLCAYARRWVDDPDTAEDLVQDFFAGLWVNSSKLEITSSLKSYFFTSVKNTAVNHLKHVKVKERYSNQVLQTSPGSEDYANWEFTEPELTGLIEKGMVKLPPRCREIFILSRFEGKDNGNIADML